MRVIFEFETRELREIKDLSCYNYIVHEVKDSKFCFTHIREVYDDVRDFPSYQFGLVENKLFISLFGGEGEPVPEGKENMGGVHIQIHIDCPEYLNLRIK
tara:strand:- start:184 stop:483 length:300 start_codon:yes stop_codon:yes gene_type:complete